MLAAAASSALPVGAVYLNPAGLGQALIYPYYTANSTGGTPFNTLVTVVNRGSDAKVIRVRFREGRNAGEVASFNLYLGAMDTWTGAVVPDAGGARFITSDQSCVNPAFPPSVEGPTRFFEFSNQAFTGTLADGMGTGPERLREGFIEMIEMGTLSTPANTSNCAAVQGVNVALAVSPPTGNLSGTLTLINVATGMNFTVNAVALANLSTRAFYRDYGDPYPDFTAAEIDPVSVITAGPQFNAGPRTYRATWTNSLDAVSSVLMVDSLGAETILDSVTNSGTDWVVTFPIRPFRKPQIFHDVTSYPRTIGTGYHDLSFTWTPRDGGPTSFISGSGVDFPETPPNSYDLDLSLPWAATVVSFAHGSANAGPIASSTVLGSANAEQVTLPGSAEDGAGAYGFGDVLQNFPVASFDHASGAVKTSQASLHGAAAVGFMVRTYLNGALTCGAVTCLGNYGGAYPFVSTRNIQMANP
ncbi:MAG: hypothetical protein WA190_14795 [Usitatibacter sp.]